MKLQRAISFISLYLLYFADLMAWSIVLLIFAPLITNNATGLIPSDVSMGGRNLIFGFLIAIYPLGQFIGSPILGELSDRFGRRKVILFSTLATWITMALSAFSVQYGWLGILFVSRLLSGIFSGNVTLAMAGVADLTSEEKRGRAMAIFSICGGLSWVLGPVVGDFFSNANIVSWFNLTTPFWFLTAVFFVAWLLLWATFKETYKMAHTDKLHLVHAFVNLAAVFKVRKVILPLICFFLTFFGWTLFVLFIPAYVTQTFGWVERTTAILLVENAAFWMLGGIISSYWLFKRFEISKAALLPISVVGIAILIQGLTNGELVVWSIMPPGAFCGAITYGALFSIFSLLVTKDMQGKVMGTGNALFSLAAALGPSVAGLLANVWIGLPFTVGGLLCLLSTILYLYWYKKVRQA